MSGAFVVEPDAWLIAASAVVVLCGLVTLIKGRVGWFLVGIVLAGAPWLVAAFVSARPRSVWALVQRRVSA